MEEKNFAQELAEWGEKVSEYYDLASKISKGLENLAVNAMKKAGVEELFFDEENGEGIHYEWRNSDGGDVNDYMVVRKVFLKGDSLMVNGDGIVDDVTDSINGEINNLDDKRKIVAGVLKKLGHDVEESWKDLSW